MSDSVPIVVEQITPNAGGENTPLVLLHGLSQQRRYWDPVIARMPQRHFIVVDQRGHGDAAEDDVTEHNDFSMDRLADDVVEVLDALDVRAAIVVGHSWGASIALHVAARHPHRIRSAVLLDGGVFGPRHLTGEQTQEQIREALRPPPLGMLEPALWQAIEAGDLSPYWSPQIRNALQATFRVDDTGRIFTKIGMQRHMAVLDGLIDYDPDPDIASVQCPLWVVSCEPRQVASATDDSQQPEHTAQPVPGDAEDDPVASAWARSRAQRVAGLPARFFVQRWSGALHDVPLQWPAMVAGLLETVVERIDPPREEIG